jgi:hypothetical protein
LKQRLGFGSKQHDDAVDALVYLIPGLVGEGIEEQRLTMSDQKHQQDWRTLLPGCFGKMDRQFAIHPEDENRAKKAIAAAKKQACRAMDFSKR